jgi:hypothetical protein
MNRFGFFLAGAVLASGLSWLILAPATRNLERFLAMPEEELLTHTEEIQKLDGLEGKMMLALLACIGWKSQNAAPRPQAAAPSASVSPTVGSAAPQAQATHPARGDDAYRPAPLPSSDPVPSATPAGGPGSGAGTPGASAPEARFFCEVARGAPVRLDAGASSPPWLALHPATPPTDPMTQDYGVVPQLGEDDRSFLSERVVDVPVTWTMGGRERERSRFFSLARGRAFEGRVVLTAQPGIRARNLRAHLHFNGQNDALDREYLLVDSGEAIFENRDFRYVDAHPAWRFGARSRGIVLLNDHCPWQEPRPRDAFGDPYDLELKELFLVESPRKLLANLYCRRRKDHAWARVGTMLLSPAGSR